MAALGLARADDSEALAAAGADLVVTTLDDVDLAALSDGRLAKRGAERAAAILRTARASRSGSSRISAPIASGRRRARRTRTPSRSIALRSTLTGAAPSAR